MLKTRSGKPVGIIGQGTWLLGENTNFETAEINTLKTGINYGMNLIDTAEMYANGGAELMTGKAISEASREDLYLVSKVYPWNAGKDKIFISCEESLARLATDYLDLYLLHWRGTVSLSETVESMEILKKQGKIRQWGVSNFDISDMEELYQIKDGKNCVVNQVLYHLGSRGVEYSLLPWMERNNILMMAYCPLAQDGRLKSNLINNDRVNQIAKNHNATPHQILLAFLCSKQGVLPIPRTSRPNHAIENAKAMKITLSHEELKVLDTEFPPPTSKMPLDIE